MRITKEAAEERDRLYKKYGNRLTADDVFQEAKDSSSRLHRYFEWDKEVCFYNYNLKIAHDIMRAEVEVLDGVVQREYVNVREEGEPKGYYKKVEDLKNSPDEFKLALDRLREKLEGALRSVEELVAVAKKRKFKVRLVVVAMKAVNAAKVAIAKIQAG